MARVTSSRDRSKGQAKQPVTSSARRPVRQRNSNATVTNSERRPSGGTARVTSNADNRRPPSGAGRRDDTNVGPKKTGRSLPSEGGTNAGSPRAQNQRAWTRDAGAKAQLRRGMTNLARSAARMAGVDRQSVAERKQAAAAKGSQGEGVREGRGRPEITRGSNPRSTQSSRIEPVSVRDVTPRRQALPPGQRGGDVAPNSRGAVANRQRPYPRPGGSVVVDESPTLPQGNRGGDLARRGRRMGSAQPQSGGSRVGNSSQPWGSRARSSSPRVPSSRALPPGKPGGPLVSGGARQTGGSAAASVARSAARSRGMDAAGKGNLAIAGLAAIQGAIASTNSKWGASVRRDMNEEQAFKDGIIKRWTQGVNVGDGRGRNFNRAETSAPGRTGRGGTTADRELARREAAKAKDKKFGTRGPAIPSRLLQQAQQQNDQPQPTPTRSQTTTSRSTGSYQAPRPSTPSLSQRPAAGASSGQSGASTAQPTAAQKWSDFNPGRGTSRTNNPLIKNDSWLMGRINQREQASADAAVEAGKASRARYNVKASPAEYNVSEEEGLRRLRAKQEEEKKKKQQAN